MQTYVVYISMLLLALLFSWRGQRTNKSKYIILAALMFTVVAGLRADSVGIDTKKYSELMELIAKGDLRHAYGLEESFKYICAFLLKIWNDHNFLYFTFALITNVLIFKRLWDFREQISLPWATAVYCGVFYFMTFNIMRQFVAVAIIFYATRYLAQKKYLKFFLAIAIATLFHNSGLLGVAFIVFDIFAWKQLTPRQKKLIRLIFIAAPIAIVVVGAAILARYGGYFDSISLNIGFMLALKLGLFTVTAIIVKDEYADEVDDTGYSMASYSFTMSRIYYLFGILVTILGYVFPYMDRVGLFFYLFETVYIGRLIRSRQVSVILKFFIVVLYLYLVVIAIAGTGQGQGDYLFFWQAAEG